MKLDRHRRTGLAIELIRRQMRLSVVSRITNLPSSTLRSLYREIHKRKPVSGQLPTTIGIFRTWSLQASASMFAALYRSLGGKDGINALNVQALMRAHDLYRAQLESLGPSNRCFPFIDITQAWVVARGLSSGTLWSRSCGHCQVDYLVAELPPLPPTCPIWTLKSRHLAFQRLGNRSDARKGPVGS